MKEYLILAVFAAVISIVDIVSFKIPDILLAGMFLFLISLDIMNRDCFLLLMSLFSGISLFGLFFLVFRVIGGMGFGDVKYAAVIGYALGFQKALYACLASVCMGILYFAMLYVTNRKKNITKSEKKIPFGPFLSFGFMLFQLIG